MKTLNTVSNDSLINGVFSNLDGTFTAVRTKQTERKDSDGKVELITCMQTKAFNCEEAGQEWVSVRKW